MIETVELHRLVPRLDTLLMVLKTCKGRACTDPWQVIHPSGDVTDLSGALDPRFDDFYEVQQDRIRFTRCEKGYIPDAEGPGHVKSFPTTEDSIPANMWSEFT